MLTKVREAGDKHYVAIENLKLLAECAMRSVSQHAAAVKAEAKAKADELQAEKKEAERQEKAAAKEKIRQQKKQEKEAAKKAKAEAVKQAKEEDAAKDKEEGKGEAKSKASRRGAGAGELTESDPPVLVNKFHGKEIQVLSDLEGFLAGISCGVPCIWRCKRSSIKKTLEAVEVAKQESAKATSSVKADMTQMAGELAAALQAGSCHVWLMTMRKGLSKDHNRYES